MALERIMIIDDNINHLLKASNYLMNEGFNVTLASNSKIALKHLLSEDFDLVLVKQNMPHLGGLAMMRHLQKEGSKSSFIIMSEFMDIKQAVKIMQKGAYSILMIPYEMNHLKEVVIRGLQNKIAFLEILKLSDNLTTVNRELKEKKKRLEYEQELLKHKIEELNFLNKLSFLMSSSLKPEIIINSLAHNLKDAFHFDILSVMILDNKEIFLKVHSKKPLEKKLMDDVNRNIHKSFAKYVGKTVYLNKISEKLPTQPDNVFHLPQGSELNINLEVAGKKLGILKIIRFDREPFSDDEKSLISTVSNQLALSLNNALEHKKYLGLASHDFLTQALNRRSSDEVIKREFARSIRYRTPLSVIMMDLDHFKKINDDWGHQTGDVVLKEVADTVSKCLRHSDIFARYGGEEFVVILPQTDISKASFFAERIRKKIESSLFNIQEGPIKLTLSLGIASYPFTEVKDKNELVSLADSALYKAKENGRNCVYIHSQNDNFCEIKLRGKIVNIKKVANSLVS